MFLTEITTVLEVLLTIMLVSVIAGTAALIVASTHDKRPRVPGEIEEKSTSQKIAALCAVVGLIASFIGIPVAILSATNREAAVGDTRPVLIEPPDTRSADFETYEEYREFMDRYFSHVENDTSAFTGHGSTDDPTPTTPPVTYTAEDGTVHSATDDPAGVS